VLKKKGGESWATLVAPFFFALLIGGSEARRPLLPRLSPLREEHFIGGATAPHFILPPLRVHSKKFFFISFFFFFSTFFFYGVPS
jgi:hypothetical protein